MRSSVRGILAIIALFLLPRLVFAQSCSPSVTVVPGHLDASNHFVPGVDFSQSTHFVAGFEFTCISYFTWTYTGWPGNYFPISTFGIASPATSGTLTAECLNGPGIITATWSDNGTSRSHSASVGPLNHKPIIELKPVLDTSSNRETVRYKITVPNSASGLLWAAVYDPRGNIVDQIANGAPLHTSVVEGDWSVSGPGTLQVRVTSCNNLYESQASIPIMDRKCRDCSNNCDRECVAHPLKTANGNVRITETDPIPTPGFLPFRRIYDSRLNATGVFGPAWTSLFDSRLMVIAGTGDPAAYVAVATDDGSDYMFQHTGGTYTQVSPPPGPNPPTLTQVSSTDWAFQDESTHLRLTFSNGKISAYKDRTSGRSLSITYDASGRPSLVSDSFAQSTWYLTFSGSPSRLTQIHLDTNPGITWTYVYDSAGKLTEVKAPNNLTWRKYELTAVTGGGSVITTVRDSRDKIIEQHAYSGFVGTTSYGPGGDVTAVQYDQPGRTADERATIFTWRTGKIDTRYIRPVGGVMRTVEISGGCTTCSSSGDGVFAYDPVTGSELRAQNARGFITEHTYFADGRLQQVRTNLTPGTCNPDSDAGRCRQTPDTLVAPTLVLNPTAATNTTTFTYDPVLKRKPASITTTGVLGGDRIATFTYDSSTQRVLTHTVTGSTGIPTRRESRTTSTVLYNGTTDVAAFDPAGSFNPAWLTLPQPKLPKSMDGPRTNVSDVTTYVYYPIAAAVTPNALRGRLAATKNALGHITRYEGYDPFGSPKRVVDPNGVPTDMTYDSLGRLLTSTLKGDPNCGNPSYDPLCGVDVLSTRTYLPAGPLALETRPAGGYTAYEYDDESRVSAVSRGPSATDLRERIETDYDPLTGKKSGERVRAFESGGWVTKKNETFAYNSEGDLITVTHMDNKTVAYTYGPDGQVSTARHENHTVANTTYAYDPAGRLTQASQTLGSGTVTTLYGYDVAGNLRSVTDPKGNITTYLYDDFGQMLEQVSPVSGTTTYTYDLAGNLTNTTDANGAYTNRVYDAASRPTSADSWLGTQRETVTFGYDSWAGLGRLASMTDPSGHTAWYYTRAGQMRAEQRNLEGTLYTTQRYVYDRDGNPIQLTYPSGNVVTYTYDYAGRPVTAAAGSTPLVTGTSYMPFGGVKGMQLGNTTAQYFVYDNRYRITTNALMAGANPLAVYAYGYDDAGNITSIDDSMDATRNRQFGYDDLNRLTSATTGSALWGTGSYTYDAMGNILTAVRGSATTNFGYLGTTPKLSSVTEPGGTVAVTYDAAGNEIASGSAYTVSPRNSIARSTTTPTYYDYVYDGAGVRTRTNIAPRLLADISWKQYSFYNPRKNLLSRLDFTTSWGTTTLTNRTEFVWFAGRPIAQFTNGDLTTRRFTATDHLGTPIIQTNSAGSVTWRAEYDPYGTIYQMRTGAEADQILRFPGQEMATDREYYNIFRWYRAGWGRYTQSDPIGLSGSDHNLYRYAWGSPTNHVDRLGLDVRVCCRNFDAPFPFSQVFDHCYIESNKNGRKTWGLYGRDILLPDGSTRLRVGIPNVNDPSDRPQAPGTKCGPWYQDCSGCLDKALKEYPTEDYSEFQANVGVASGRNSNTFVKCLLRKCGVSSPRGVTVAASGYAQPCPSGF